jgi:predicted phosphate transport protein (TIGR00153 family)
MLGRFMPQEGRFFDMFNAHAREIVLGADALLAMLAALNDAPAEAEKQAAIIDVVEDRADKITHETVALLHSTFITPLDRDEIHQLITRLDDILDTIQKAARTVNVYDLRRATAETLRFAEIIQAIVQRVQHAVSLLSNMDNGPVILTTCREIGTLENDADTVLRDAMSKLFREEADVRELIKLKAVYELLENVTDICDDVGNILEAIVLENS